MMATALDLSEVVFQLHHRGGGGGGGFNEKKKKNDVKKN
jgi:hypothetical protein